MADGPEIHIKLTTDAEQILAQMQEVADAAKSAFESTMTASIDKAQKKIYALTSAIQNNSAVIEANKAKVADLEAKRTTSSESAIKQINSEIDALNKLTQARQLENIAIELKKTKLEAQVATSQATTDQEKLGIQLVTQSRMIGIQAIQDQARAAIAASQTETQAAAATAASLKDAARQTATEARETAKVQADAAKEQERLAKDAAKEAKQDASEQAKAEADLAADRRQASKELEKSMSDFAKGQAAAAAQIDATRGKIDELISKQDQLQTVIDAGRKKIDELSLAKQNASVAEQKQIVKQIENLNRAISKNEDEKLAIEAKRIALDETLRISVAGSEAAIEAIQAESAEHRTEIQIIREQGEALRDNNEEVDKGVPLVGQLMSAFAGAFSIVGILTTIKEIVAAYRMEIEAIVQAGEKLRDLSTSEFDKMKPFYDEYQLTSDKDQQDAMRVIAKIGHDNNVLPSVVARTGAASRAALDGIDIKSDQYADILGQESKFTSLGMDQTLVADFVADARNPKFGGDPKLTGDQLNQQLTNVIKVTGGSTSRANELLRVQQEDKAKATGVHFSLEEIEKLFMEYEKQGISAHQIAPVARQFFQATDRLAGMDSKQLLDQWVGMQNFDPIYDKEIKRIESLLPAKKVMPMLSHLPRPQGIPELDEVYQQGIKKGAIDVREAISIIGALPEERKGAAGHTIAPEASVSQSGRKIGGARGANAFGLGAGFQNQAPPKNAPLLPKSDSKDQATEVAKEIGDLGIVGANRPDQDAAEFTQVLKDDHAGVQTEIERMNATEHGGGQVATDVATLGTNEFISTSVDEMTAFRELSRKLIYYVRLREQIKSGSVKATPQQLSALQTGIEGIYQRIQDSTGGDLQPLKTLAQGQRTDFYGAVVDTAANQLKQVDAQGQNQFIWDLKQHDVENIYKEITDPRKAAVPLSAARQAEESIRSSNPLVPAGPPAPTGPPAPATQPATTQPSGPVSYNTHNVTNHVRQVIYGGSYASIGAPNSYTSNYG